MANPFLAKVVVETRLQLKHNKVTGGYTRNKQRNDFYNVYSLSSKVAKILNTNQNRDLFLLNIKAQGRLLKDYIIFDTPANKDEIYLNAHLLSSILNVSQSSIRNGINELEMINFISKKPHRDYTEKEKKGSGKFMYYINPSMVDIGANNRHAVEGTVKMNVYIDVVGNLETCIQKACEVLNEDFKHATLMVKFYDKELNIVLAMGLKSATTDDSRLATISYDMV